MKKDYHVKSESRKSAFPSLLVGGLLAIGGAVCLGIAIVSAVRKKESPKASQKAKASSSRPQGTCQKETSTRASEGASARKNVKDLRPDTSSGKPVASENRAKSKPTMSPKDDATASVAFCEASTKAESKPSTSPETFASQEPSAPQEPSTPQEASADADDPQSTSIEAAPACEVSNSEEGHASTHATLPAWKPMQAALTPKAVQTVSCQASGPGRTLSGRAPPSASHFRRFSKIKRKGDETIMLSNWTTHEQYVSRLFTVYHESEEAGRPLCVTPSQKELMRKMLLFNPDPFLPILSDLYSEKNGRPSWDPSLLLRSLMLYVMVSGKAMHGHSLTKWAEETVKEPLYLALCGFQDDKVPGIGVYYDLIHRLWAGDCTRYNRDVFFSAVMNYSKEKIKVGPDNKIVDTKFSVDEMVDAFLRNLRLSGNSERYLQQFLALVAVARSYEYGIIPRVTCISADSTAWAEHASPFGRCRGCGNQKRMNCPHREYCGMSARFGSVDGSIGWDSGRKCKFFGEHLHLLTSRNEELGCEVPICFSLMDANRHDSVCLPVLLQEAYRNIPGLYMSYFFGDSAYDHPPIYDLLLRKGTVPVITLNTHNLTYPGLPKGVTMNVLGHPVCKAGTEMAFVRNNEEKKCWEYACPALVDGECRCEMAEKCPLKEADTLVISIDPKDSPRFFPPIRRDSKEFSDLFKMRTGSERVNNTLLNNSYELDEFAMRNAHHRSLLAALCCVGAHINAWDKAGMRPEDETAARFYEELLDGKQIAPLRKIPGRTLFGDADIAKLVARNRRERIEEKMHFEIIKALHKSFSETATIPKCLKDVTEALRQSGLDPFDPQSATPREESEWERLTITIQANEKWFTKTWERTFIDYSPPDVILGEPDPERYPDEPKGYWISVNGVKGFFVELVAPHLIKPRVVNGFTEVKPGVWTKPGPGPTVQVEDAPGMPGILEGFEVIPTTPTVCSDEKYEPPIIPRAKASDKQEKAQKNQADEAQGQASEKQDQASQNQDQEGQKPDQAIQTCTDSTNEPVAPDVPPVQGLTADGATAKSVTLDLEPVKASSSEGGAQSPEDDAKPVQDERNYRWIRTPARPKRKGVPYGRSGRSGSRVWTRS